MKKFFFLSILILASNILNAQYVPKFKMNYNGAFTTQDGKSFDVAVVDNKNATELFDIVRKHVALTYNSPKEVESNVEDKIIAIYSYAKNCTLYTAPGMKFYLSFHYSLKIQFKDNKIRIEAPILCDMDGSAWGTLQKTFKAKGIFSKDGVLSDKPKKRQTVTMLENYFNDLINRIINGDARAKENW